MRKLGGLIYGCCVLVAIISAGLYVFGDLTSTSDDISQEATGERLFTTWVLLSALVGVSSFFNVLLISRSAFIARNRHKIRWLFGFAVGTFFAFAPLLWLAWYRVRKRLPDDSHWIENPFTGDYRAGRTTSGSDRCLHCHGRGEERCWQCADTHYGWSSEQGKSKWTGWNCVACNGTTWVRCGKCGGSGKI